MLIVHNLYGSTFNNREIIFDCIQKKLIDINYNYDKINDVVGTIEIIEFTSNNLL